MAAVDIATDGRSGRLGGPRPVATAAAGGAPDMVTIPSVNAVVALRALAILPRPAVVWAGGALVEPPEVAAVFDDLAAPLTPSASDDEDDDEDDDEEGAFYDATDGNSGGGGIGRRSPDDGSRSGDASIPSRRPVWTTSTSSPRTPSEHGAGAGNGPSPRGSASPGRCAEPYISRPLSNPQSDPRPSSS